MQASLNLNSDKLSSFPNLLKQTESFTTNSGLLALFEGVKIASSEKGIIQISAVKATTMTEDFNEIKAMTLAATSKFFSFFAEPSKIEPAIDTNGERLKELNAKSLSLLADRNKQEEIMEEINIEMNKQGTPYYKNTGFSLLKEAYLSFLDLHIQWLNNSPYAVKIEKSALKV